MENEKNLTVSKDEYGNIITNDPEINKTLREVEEETGLKLAAAMPAVTFSDDPSSKPYLLLLKLTDDEEHMADTMWCVQIGRQDTYDYLKNLIKSEAIDLHHSFVMSGNIKFEDAITVFRFMKTMRDDEKILDGDEEFNIDDYTLGEGFLDPKITD